MIAQERYNAIVIGADSTVTINNSSIGGFLAKTAGTVSITNSVGTVIVNAHPVAAGGYYPLPFYLGSTGGSITTAGGASGTLAIN